MGKNKYLLKEQNVEASQEADASVSSVRQEKFTALTSRFKVKPTETEIRKTKAEDEGGWANFEEYKDADVSVSSVRQEKFTALTSRFKVKPTETEIRKTKAEDEGGWANFEEYNKSL